MRIFKELKKTINKLKEEINETGEYYVWGQIVALYIFIPLFALLCVVGLVPFKVVIYGVGIVVAIIVAFWKTVYETEKYKEAIIIDIERTSFLRQMINAFLSPFVWRSIGYYIFGICFWFILVFLFLLCKCLIT